MALLKILLRFPTMKTKRTYKDDLDNSAGSGKCTFSRVDLNKSINVYL